MFERIRTLDALYNDYDRIADAVRRFYTAADLNGVRFEVIETDLKTRLNDETGQSMVNPKLLKRALSELFKMKGRKMDTQDGEKIIMWVDDYKPLWP